MFQKPSEQFLRIPTQPLYPKLVPIFASLLFSLISPEKSASQHPQAIPTFQPPQTETPLIIREYGDCYEGSRCAINYWVTKFLLRLGETNAKYRATVFTEIPFDDTNPKLSGKIILETQSFALEGNIAIVRFKIVDLDPRLAGLKGYISLYELGDKNNRGEKMFFAQKGLEIEVRLTIPDDPTSIEVLNRSNGTIGVQIDANDDLKGTQLEQLEKRLTKLLRPSSSPFK